MSHIEVTDEMKARVLANVSKAIAEQEVSGEAKASVTPMPVKKKHISIIPIISIAASVLIIGGIAFMFISGYMNSGSTKKSKTYNVKTDTEAAEAADEAEAGFAFGEGAKAPEVDDTVTEGECEYDGDTGEECEETTTSTSAAATYSSEETLDINTLVPSMSYDMVESDVNGNRVVTFNSEDNSAVVYIAGEENADLPSLYLKDFDNDSSMVTNGVTDSGINYALINTGSLEGTYNAASFNHGGQTYLIVFEKPVEEENIREVISGY